MADWAQVALVVGPAAVTGLTGYFIAHLQNRSAHKRLELQLNDARAREERERKREVRSAPLLAFREQVATFPTFLEQVAISFNRQRPDLVEYWIKRHDEWAASGSLGRAKFQLTDRQLWSKAEEVSQACRQAIEVSRDGEKMKEKLSSVYQQVAELQELINQRLETL